MHAVAYRGFRLAGISATHYVVGLLIFDDEATLRVILNPWKLRAPVGPPRPRRSRSECCSSSCFLHSSSRFLAVDFDRMITEHSVGPTFITVHSLQQFLRMYIDLQHLVVERVNVAAVRLRGSWFPSRGRLQHIT